MLIANPFVFLMLTCWISSFVTDPRARLLTTCFCIAIASICIPFIQLTDNVAYELFYTSASQIEIENSRFEAGYYFLNRFASQIVNYEVFRGLCIFLILSSKIYLLSQFTRFIPLALVFYFAFQFYVDSYLIRASLAASFVGFALVARLKRRSILGFFCLIAAVSMHLSALFVVPLWVVVNFKMTKMAHIIILLTLFIVAQFPLAELAAHITGILFSSYNFATTFVSYVGSTHGQAVGVLRGSVLMYSMIYLFFIIVVDHNRSKFSYENNFVINCMLFALACLLAFNDMVVISDRLSRFTLFFFVIGLMIAVRSLQKKTAGQVYFLISSVSVITGLVLDEGPYAVI